jgi:tRNA/rRNA methyltransferase
MAKLPEFPPGWHCYLLLCASGSYYCGITSNLADRIRDHASGKGSSYTKKVRPIAFVWYESHKSRRSAASRERQIKAWVKERKRALANSPLGHAGYV